MYSIMCFIIPPLQWGEGVYCCGFFLVFKQIFIKDFSLTINCRCLKIYHTFCYNKPCYMMGSIFVPIGHQLHVKCQNWLILNIYIRAKYHQ